MIVAHFQKGGRDLRGGKSNTTGANDSKNGITVHFCLAVVTVIVSVCVGPVGQHPAFFGKYVIVC